MSDTILGRLGTYSMTTPEKAEPRAYPALWQAPEIDIFNHVKACLRVAKIDPPQELIDAIRSGDVPVLREQISNVLELDIQMSDKLRKRCIKWLAYSVPASP